MAVLTFLIAVVDSVVAVALLLLSSKRVKHWLSYSFFHFFVCKV
jgi:hypothetical protein